ncbi:hypothetical protein HPB51_023164 [Rhipicephalus microplus]|uniref:Uncharacterized protein n=1 Tax=Rhipicephalus microplus TaxID=6941 RepID=A0A9J6DJC3_RHIMP|nr:hypothetical protein HPB51_023164 [Rhipicephalus microplus]
MAALQTAPPPSLQPSPPPSKAEFLKSVVSCNTSLSESDTFHSAVGGFSDGPQLSPVVSSDGEHSIQRSISYLFSHSTGGEEFDEASLSNRMSSVAGECHQSDQWLTWSRCGNVVAFLVAAAVVCVSAIMVTLTWTVLSHGNMRQLLEDKKGVMSTQSVESDMLLQNAPVVKWPSTNKMKPLINGMTSSVNPGTESTIFLDADEKPPVQLTDMTQSSLSIATNRRHAREPLKKTSVLPRQRTLKRHLTFTRRKAATPRHNRHIDLRPHMRVLPMRKPMNQRCGLPFYTYCPKLRHEAYYRHSTRSCVLTITDDVQVCNHSPNKFATLAECQRSCVHARMPSGACLDKPLFSRCSRCVPAFQNLSSVHKMVEISGVVLS